MNPQHRDLTPAIVRRLTVDTEPWLSCDDCFRVMDVYVERILTSPDEHPPSDAVDAMRTHLAGCSACAEEATSLLLLVAAESGIDPGPAVQRLCGA